MLKFLDEPPATELFIPGVFVPPEFVAAARYAIADFNGEPPFPSLVPLVISCYVLLNYESYMDRYETILLSILVMLSFSVFLLPSSSFSLSWIADFSLSLRAASKLVSTIDVYETSFLYCRSTMCLSCFLMTRLFSSNILRRP